MKNLRNLFDRDEVETLFEYAGFSPSFDALVEGDNVSIIVAIAAYALDEADGTGNCPIALGIAKEASDAENIALGAAVFAKALETDYSQVLGLIDGWMSHPRNLSNAAECPKLIHALAYSVYYEMGESLAREMTAISLRRHSEDIGLTEADVRMIAGVSNDGSIAGTDGAIDHMLTIRGYEPEYIQNRLDHRAYEKTGGTLKFVDWREDKIMEN